MKRRIFVHGLPDAGYKFSDEWGYPVRPRVAHEHDPYAPHSDWGGTPAPTLVGGQRLEVGDLYWEVAGINHHAEDLTFVEGKL